MCLVLTFLCVYLFPSFGQTSTLDEPIQTAAAVQPWTQTTEDRLPVGNFVVLQCGSDSSPNNAQRLSLALSDMSTNLLRVIDDAALGDISEHGYTAFFKDLSSRSHVRDTYTRIKQGFPIHTRENLQKPHGRAQPTIICVNDDDPNTIDLQAFCNQPGAVAVQLSYSPGIVGICPLFWPLRSAPLKVDCPILENNKLFPPNDAASIDRTRYHVLVHELAHLYITNAPRETYDIQGCVELNATASLMNAQNFAFYASTERANCTEFPPVLDLMELNN